jgi:carnitine-CoA ligase
MVDHRCDADIVWRYLLERHAAETPDHPAYIFPYHDDLTWTWSEADSRANQVASALAGTGIRKGDVVALLSENSPEMIATLLGATKLGAIILPLNTAFRGTMLLQLLSLANAKAVVASHQLAPRLAEDASEKLNLNSAIVVRSEVLSSEVAAELAAVDFDDLVDHSDGTSPPDPGIHFWDPYAVICTSGTTGRSKGVLSPYGQIYAAVEYHMVPRSSQHDVFLGDMVLFHVGGMLSFETALVVGASLVVCPRPSSTGYWERIHKYGITHTVGLGVSMSQIAAKDVPEANEHGNNPVRRVLISGWSSKYEEMKEQFGLEDVYGCFNMTEMSSPLIDAEHPTEGSLGVPRPGAQVKLVDDHDLEVPAGHIGELIVRTELPWEMNLGYVNMPDATLEAWRNGWFHTGDLMRQDAEGQFHFVDRKKDVVRIKGENVSSFEVEIAIMAHGSVSECAVIPLRTSDGEAVGAYVVPAPGVSLDPAELVEFVRQRLPFFAVPRYLDIVTSPLPRTQGDAGKVRKGELRERGITATMWDRVAAGVNVSRS